MILKRNMLHFKQDRKLGKVKKLQQKSCKNKQVMRKMSCARCQMTPLTVLVLTTNNSKLITTILCAPPAFSIFLCQWSRLTGQRLGRTLQMYDTLYETTRCTATRASIHVTNFKWLLWIKSPELTGRPVARGGSRGFGRTPCSLANFF